MTTTTATTAPSTTTRSRQRLAALLLSTCLAVAACSGDDPDRSADRSGSSRSSQSAAPDAGLRAPARCAGQFTCATLEVPLDRADPDHGTLPLRVATETTTAADRGLLLVLAGGPGQAGVPLIERLVETLGSDVADAYRIAVIDQGGTGATALDCPALQRAMGLSDLTPPPHSAARSTDERLEHSLVGALGEFTVTGD